MKAADQRPLRRPHRRRLVLGPAVAIAVLAGCSSNGATTGNATTEPPRSTQTITTGTVSLPPVTLTSTVGGSTILAAPPAATSEPPPVDGVCPYLPDDVVADINGQRAGTTQVIDVPPHPICVFSRSDGAPLASIRIIQADSPQAAVAAVDAHVPIDGSDPASQPPGWTGGSMVTESGSVYAVSKGNIAVVAESNQQQSIKGRQMVITAIANLGL